MGFKDLRLGIKLPLLMVGGVVATAVVLGSLLVQQSRVSLKIETESRLAQFVGDRQLAMSDYLESIRQDIRVQSINPTVINGLKELTSAWAEFGDGQTQKLQKLYIDDNPHPLGKKDEMDFQKDGSTYSEVHGRFQPVYRQMIRESGYYDFFLFDMNGNCVFTVFKERDFATNLLSGQWKDSDLAVVYKRARDLKPGEPEAFVDFKPYEPSANVPASFIAAPIIENGKTIGVIAFQMPIDRLNRLAQAPEALGKTSDGFAVGKDFLLRTDSRLSKESTLLKLKNENPAVAKALGGEKGVEEIDGKVVAFVPLDFLGVRWAMIAQIEGTEVYAPIDEMFRSSVINGILVVLAVAFVGGVISRGISKPLVAQAKVMDKLADNDFSVAVPYQDRGDEIGDIGKSLELFKGRLADNERLRAQQERMRAESEALKTKALREMADTVENESSRVVTQVAEQTAKLTAAAERMANSATLVSGNAQNVAAAAEESLVNAQTVSAASEELTASISEIVRLVTMQSEIAKQASVQADRTSETINSLNASAVKIGDVVNLIREVAAQTNLLALNATIEAARAGEMGKGFAVVAGEVKNLATQTATATDEIVNQVGAMREATQRSVAAVQEVGGIIKKMNEIAGSVAAAMSEQSAATGEISGNVAQTTQASQEVTERIAEVSQEAREAGQISSLVSELAADVSVQITKLQASLTRVVRSSAVEVNRRSDVRLAPPDERRVHFFDSSLPTSIMTDISTGGLSVMPNISSQRGQQVEIEIDGLPGKYLMEIVSFDSEHTRFKFVGELDNRPKIVSMVANLWRDHLVHSMRGAA